MTVAESMYHVGKKISDSLEWQRVGGKWYLFGPLGVREGDRATTLSHFGPIRSPFYDRHVIRIKLLKEGFSGDEPPSLEEGKRLWHEAIAEDHGAVEPTAMRRFKIIYKNATLTE